MWYKYSTALNTFLFLISTQNNHLRFRFSLFPSKIQWNCRTNISTKDTNSSQTQQFYYIIILKTTCFNCIESSLGLVENRSNVWTFIVHSGIQKLTVSGIVNIEIHVSETRVLLCIHTYIHTYIDKAIPLQAWTGPEGSRSLKLPDFKTIGTWRW